jgi:hypothetical protein
MLASALTGARVPELLAALDRREKEIAEARATDPDGSALKRAEAQLSGILAERVAIRLRDPARAEQRERTLRAVAAHEMDPYSAADALLAALTEKR